MEHSLYSMNAPAAVDVEHRSDALDLLGRQADYSLHLLGHASALDEQTEHVRSGLQQLLELLGVLHIDNGTGLPGLLLTGQQTASLSKRSTQTHTLSVSSMISR